MSPVKNDGATTATLVSTERIVHYVGDRLVSGIIEAMYHDSASITATWLEILEGRVFNADLRASSACEAMARRRGTWVVHVNVIEGDYRVDSADMILAATGESRIHYAHSPQLDHYIRLIVVLEVCSI